MKLCTELASFKMEHVFARKAHLIAAMIRWDMSRQLRSLHTCCDRSDSLLFYRIFFVVAETVLVISYELYATGLDLSIGLDLSEQASSPPVCGPSYLKFFDYEDMRARAAVAASWIRPA